MLTGILLIAATYFYFLIFAQFAFLEIAKSNLGLTAITPTMAVMGISGMVFSLLAPKIINAKNKKLNLNGIELGLLVCSLTGLASYLPQNFYSLISISFFIGAGLAILTVSLADSLTEFFSPKNIGIYTGIGTGLAYFICNIPAIFTSTPQAQGLMVALSSLLAFLVSKYSNLATPLQISQSKKNQFSRSLLVYILAFTALVWLDSSAFFVIQSAGELKSATWAGSNQLWTNALIHLFSACFAGVLIDRGRITLVLVIAYVSLALGVTFVQTLIELKGISSVFYCTGVSFYSTALVAFPSYFTEKYSLTIRIWISAILYAVAGWFGSAMGIGMAQDLNRVPLGFLIISGFVIILNIFVQKKQIPVKTK